MKANSNRAMTLVENRNVPGYTHRVDAKKYAAMKKALLKILPKGPPGITQAEMFATVPRHLPQEEFPGGEKAEWWAKTVQLDLEAKGVVDRDIRAKPLRWYRGS
jgi:uncharacterized protein DUF6958